MAEYKHSNLFNFAENAKEVYSTLQRDYNKDTKIKIWSDTVSMISAGVFVYLSDDIKWFFFFLAIFALGNSLNFFIENSNRNWVMHLIDWIENSKGKAE